MKTADEGAILAAIRQYIGDRTGYWMCGDQCAAIRDIVLEGYAAIAPDLWAEGYAQGIEDAAKVCDKRIGRLMDEGSGKEETEWRDHEAARCRDAIRALTAPTATPQRGEGEG